METSRIVIATLLVISFVCAILLLIWSYIDLKRSQNTVIRHFVGRQEIGKAHKFSEWEKCEVCRLADKGKTSQEIYFTLKRKK